MPASKCVSCNMSIGLMVVSLAYVVISVGVTMCVAIQLIVGIIVPASMSVVVFAISLIIECDGSCLIRCQCFDFSRWLYPTYPRSIIPMYLFVMGCMMVGTLGGEWWGGDYVICIQCATDFVDAMKGMCPLGGGDGDIYCGIILGGGNNIGGYIFTVVFWLSIPGSRCFSENSSCC